jgi:GT2 family glycosyltransferase
VGDVSCVVVTHERPGFLRDALATVGAQTRPPLEVVVVDDTADWSVGAVCADAADRWDLRVAYHPFPAGGGASASRNRGAAVARGDVLAFLDDDDCWAPNYLEQAITALERTRAAATVTRLCLFREGAVAEGRSVQAGLAPADVLAVNPGVTGSSIVIRRDAFQALGGFDESLSVSNDKDFFYRLLRAGLRYAVVPDPLVYKREHGSGRLTASDPRRIGGLERYREKWRQALSAAHHRRLDAEVLRAEFRAAPGLWRRLGLLFRLLRVEGTGALRRRRRRWHPAPADAPAPVRAGGTWSEALR